MEWNTICMCTGLIGAFIGIGIFLTAGLVRRRRSSGGKSSAWKDGVAPDKQAYLPCDSDSPRKTLAKHRHAHREMEQWHKVMCLNAVKLVRDRHEINAAVDAIHADRPAPQSDPDESAAPPPDSDDKK